jgi:hypothetical protein
MPLSETTPYSDLLSCLRRYSSWTQFRKLYYLAVKDTSKVLVLQLYKVLHSLQVQNELLHHQNDAMKEALSIKQKHAKKSRLLLLIQHQDMTVVLCGNCLGACAKLRFGMRYFDVKKSRRSLENWTRRS